MLFYFFVKSESLGMAQLGLRTPIPCYLSPRLRPTIAMGWVIHLVERVGIKPTTTALQKQFALLEHASPYWGWAVRPFNAFPMSAKTLGDTFKVGCNTVTSRLL